ncbi:MAG: endonuclease/exonuclease/phosphatase family protein [Pseudomonadota bacterium]
MLSMFSRERRAEKAAAVDAVANFHHAHTASALLDHWQYDDDLQLQVPQRLKLLTFNIQVGIKTTAYRQYLTKGWKHVLPHEARARNLRKIAQLVADYDLVGLQEIDGGSLRSGFINQVEFLAQAAGFPYWYAQLNRDLGPLAQHGNGLLTRIQPAGLEDHKLPGAIPGRGAVFLRIPFAGEEVVVVMLHLSLGERSRRQQLSYIAECVGHERHVILMGDMNTPLSALMEDSPLGALSLQAANLETPTYPAWRPALALDHVLVSPSLKVQHCEVLDCNISDHLPIAVEVSAAEAAVPPLQ